MRQRSSTASSRRFTRDGPADEHPDTDRTEQLPAQPVGPTEGGQLLTGRDQAVEVQHGGQQPEADEPTDDEINAAAPGQEPDTDGHQRERPHAVHVVGHSDPLAQGDLGMAGADRDRVHDPGEQRAAQQVVGLAEAGAGGLEDRGDGDAAREGEPLEIDHLLAQRNDERDAQHAAGDAPDHHQRDVEIRVAENEQGRDREHHARRGRVDRAGEALVDVVLDDAVAAHRAAEDGEPQDGRELGALDGEAN